MHAVVFDNGVLFFAQCVRECSRWCVRKWGAQRPREGNPYFYSVSWVSTGQQLAQRASRICSVVPGHHAENEASSNRKSGLWHFHLHPQLRRVWGLRLSVAGGHAQNCGENGFFTLPVPKIQWKGPKAGTSKNGQIYLCWRAPPHFVRFVGAPGFRQKRVFENRAIFAETTENVVPNGRGSKTHFCTVGFEIGHLTSASNIVPKYFSLNWHFLSHSPSRRQAELFYFSCLFPFLRTGPFLYFSWLHFFLQQLLQFVLFVVFLFCCFCWLCLFFCWCLCFWFYFVIPFSLLTSVFLFFLSCSFSSFFAFHVFSSCCLSYPPPVFLSFSYVSFCDSPLSCSHVSFCPLFSFSISFDCFLLCVFSPCSSSFSSFVFSSPQAPACAWEGQPWIEQPSHFVCLSGIFAKMSFAHIYCVFTFWWISFCSQSMYLLDIVGICFEGVRDSWLLFLICCYIVVLVFGAEPSFSPTCLLCQHFWGFVLFCVRVFLFWVLLLLSSFVEVYCFLVLLIFLILGWCYFAAVWSCWFFTFMSWLVVCASRFRCCHFVVNLVGGACGQGHPGGVNIFFAVFHNRSVWAKTRTSPQGEDFLERFWLRNRAWKGPKNYSVFNFGARNAIKIGVSGSFFEDKKDKKCANLIYETHFCSYHVVRWKYSGGRFGGGQKHTQNRHEMLQK